MTTAEITTLSAAIVLGALQAYSTWRGRQRDKVIEKIHILTNSQMGLTKRNLAEVTAAKYAITKDATDKLAAEEAMAGYLDHIKRQTDVDNLKV